jgi:hypothetical protein
MSEEEVAPPPAPEASAPESADYWRKRAEKAEKQAIERKLELRRTQVAGKHGVDPGLIPDWVPADKLEEFGSKFLVASQSDSPDTTARTEQVETPEAESTPTEQKLAAVSKGPSSTSASPPSGFTQDELLQIAMKDPERYQKLSESGQGLQKLGDDPKYFGHNR